MSDIKIVLKEDEKPVDTYIPQAARYYVDHDVVAFFDYLSRVAFKSAGVKISPTKAMMTFMRHFLVNGCDEIDLGKISIQFGPNTDFVGAIRRYEEEHKGIPTEAQSSPAEKAPGDTNPTAEDAERDYESELRNLIDLSAFKDSNALLDAINNAIQGLTDDIKEPSKKLAARSKLSTIRKQLIAEFEGEK